MAESRCDHLTSTSLLPKMASMSPTEICHVAYTAKIKLRRASSATERDLRLLVGHSNLLRTLADDFTVSENDLGQMSRKASVISQPVCVERATTASNQTLSDGKTTIETITANFLASNLPYGGHFCQIDAIEDETDIAFDDENDAEHVLTRVPSRRPF
ncbi:hypothetical protein M433DRAFT_147515 [Acidomyces richmondensis BFW]|jgi:hypothetical protein|nr:MAG: hypothetical protein FE78DRAFT_313059 [Acidomyces sp. 'richmondensis']KYG41619.1 hypothetical protein M433DRAFT_147515 [Acidomyces richmondensis BFW]